MRITKRLMNDTEVRNFIVDMSRYTLKELEESGLDFIFESYRVCLIDIDKIEIGFDEYNNFVNIAKMKDGKEWFIEL